MVLPLLPSAVAAQTAALAPSASTAGRSGASGTPAVAGLTLPSWEWTGNLRGAVGFKDNLLLSAVRKQSSLAVQAEVEGFGWRLPTDKFEALLFANAAQTRFPDSDENPRELQAFAQAEARWFARPELRAMLAAQGYYMDQVFDLSTDTVERVTAKLRVRGASATTALHWTIRSNTWMEVKPTAQRDLYHDGSDDNRQATARLALGRSLRGGAVEVSLAGQLLERRYDGRVQYTAAGRPLAGTRLTFRQSEGQVRIEVVWDRAKTWQTLTTVGAMANNDNGQGYFNYRLRQARQEITWTRDRWKLRATGRVGRYDYEVQTVGIGIEPPKRLKEELASGLRAEYRLNDRWTFSADYLGERSRSNDPLATYRVQTFLAGVDRSF